MTKEETFNYCKESFKNFIIPLYDQIKNSEDKLNFESTLTFACRVESNELKEITQFGTLLTKSIAHYGTELISDLKKVFEEVVPLERRIEWN